MGPNENDPKSPDNDTALETDDAIRALFAQADGALVEPSPPVDIVVILDELNPEIKTAFDQLGEEAASRVTPSDVEEMIKRLKNPPQKEGE